jgi:hypothetical protein
MTVLEAIAAHGLRSRHELPTAPLDADTAQELVAGAESHRVLGLLTAAMRSDAIELPDDERASLELLERAWLGHDLRLERLMVRARARLRAEGIASRVLEGVALAHTAYREPSMRVFGDVDLLVPGDRVLDAIRVLEEGLATRAQPELRPGSDERFGSEVLLGTGELEIDVLRVFVEGAPRRTIDTSDLFAPPYRFGLGGDELETLPMPQRLLHACDVAALGDCRPRLISLRDVAQLVLSERPNLVDVLLMARRWQCEAVVALAVSTAWDRLALTDRAPIVDWADNYAPSRRDRVLLAAHHGPARAFTRHLAALVVLPGAAGADASAGSVGADADAEPRWRRRPDALWRRSLDAVLVLPVGTDEPVTLAGTGPALWELLAEPCTVAQLAAVLSEAFAAEPTTVVVDIAPVIDELVRLQALESA